MVSSPRVSAVVTCFNLGAYLPEALDSIRAQTFRDFEICVVDDGSTEPATVQLLRSLGRDVRVVYSDNRGLSAARNLGVARTSGEFICAVDADDVLAPTLFERSIARLDSDPSLTFVSHWLEAFGDESWEWKPERCDFPGLLDVNTVNGAALVRRTAVEAVGGWDEALRDGCEDWDFWITLVERGFRGDILPEILFRYRRRADSMSRVNFAGAGLPRIFRQLVEKHAETYRTHLRALVVRREADVAGNRAQADDLEARLELDVQPALARARADVAAAERRRAHWDEARALIDETHALREANGTLRETNGALRAEVETLQSDLTSTRQEVSQLNSANGQVSREVDALRASWSWRLTWPLRAIGSLVPRSGGRRS